ncbi:hypothetical protein FKV24_007450 [Lysobacter maris]|uniref:Uncharacterized protein n=1 Tax=Marilutibacter maris TaxID=1605891 RepID=A0A508AWA9_9GAMM|nr:hypothetical protein [Lysobacter maris]KAB8192109.1 hypothetical protein FKV24_007450 [Lysobacter maris]
MRRDRRFVPMRWALSMLLSCGFIAAVDAQTIDEPGVHLVDPHSSARHGDEARVAEHTPARGGMPGKAHCVARAGGDARPGNCIGQQVRAPDDARDQSIEAARRSGVELGTHVRDRTPQRPSQRGH